MYDGPIFVEELDVLKRNDKQIKITLARPGEEVKHEKIPERIPMTRDQVKSA
jgi:hypothetical protein